MDDIENKTNLRNKDNVFKGIIRKADVLAAFLHTYVDEFRECSKDTILNCIPKEINDEYAQERNVFPDSGKENEMEMDTLFRVKLPDSDESIAVYVNVEGQNTFLSWAYSSLISFGMQFRMVSLLHSLNSST